MSTVFPASGTMNLESAGTHVLIIGVGGYPHLLGGDPKQQAKSLMGLEQLSSPPVSAQALADWFRGPHIHRETEHGFYNPKAPLASIEMLVSPPWKPKNKMLPHRCPIPGGGNIAVEGASEKNISDCYNIWLQRMKTNANNIGVFYFCGHGVTGVNDYVLPADFGTHQNNVWRDAIDIKETARAARREVEGALYFFIDSCRETKPDALKPGAAAQPLHDVDFKKSVRCLSRLMLWATGESQAAHGVEGKVSRFTSALIKALSNYYGEPLPKGCGWGITGPSLARQVSKIIAKENDSLDVHRHQHVEMESIGSHLFHYETNRPKLVGVTASTEFVNPHIRNILDRTLGEKTLPPMVKESIAEKVESGKILLNQMEQEVNRWLSGLKEWSSRLAAEPNRKIAEQAKELFEAEKLTEAGELFDRLIQAAEERVVEEYKRLESYHASQAEMFVRQLKWKDAVLHFKKAIVKGHLVHGNTPKRSMANHFTNLGEAYFSFGQYEKAQGYFKKARDIDQHIYSKIPHPDLARDLNNIGKTLHIRGEYESAIQYYQKALRIDEKVYGQTPHPDVARDLSNLGNAWDSKGKYSKAIQYYQKALEIDEKVYKKTPHRAMARNFLNLGVALHNLGKFDKAIHYFQKALKIDKKVYGKTPHPDVAVDLNNLGESYRALHNYNEAIKYYQKALRIDEKVYGQTPHPDVARDLNNLGEALYSLGQYKKAKDYLSRALAIYNATTLPKNHPRITTVRRNLAKANKHKR